MGPGRVRAKRREGCAELDVQRMRKMNVDLGFREKLYLNRVIGFSMANGLDMVGKWMMGGGNPAGEQVELAPWS